MSVTLVRAFAFSLLAVLVLAIESHASTIVDMSEGDIAVSSRSIVEGTVVAQEARHDPSAGVVFTYVEIEVAAVHKGGLVAQRVVLKQIGGVDGEYVTTVHGAPKFANGDRVLVFLTTDPEGSLRVAHLCLGHYRVLVGRDGTEVVVRATTDAEILEKQTAGAVPREDFLRRIAKALDSRWVESVRLEAERYPEAIQAIPLELRDAPVLKGGPSRFTFLGSGFRWFQPDTGELVFFRVNTRNGPTATGGVNEAKASFAAWSGVGASELRLGYLGGTDKCGLRADGDNTISFGDCNNMLDDPVNCSGVVAIGGVTSAGGGSIVIGGRQFTKTIEGDVVFNNGFECLISNPTNLGEVLTHELGHVLGLGHSSQNFAEPSATLRDATMYFVTHKDGRGASVRQDDSDGIRFMYGTYAAEGAVVRSEVLPDGLPNKQYTFKLKAVGTRPFTWSVASGSLPRGLAVSADGTISGTAELEQTTSFVVQVRDATGDTDTQQLSIRVTASPTPFLEEVSFDSKKLTVLGSHLADGASVRINGVTVARPVKFKAKKGSLKVSGTADQLGLRTISGNTVSVTVSGRTSNTVRF